MQSVADGIKKTMAKFLYESGECPNCGDQMLSWKEPSGKPPRCPPICMACGHKELVKQSEEDVMSKELIVRKSNVMGFLKNNSIIKDKSLYKCNFENYVVSNTEQANALEVCQKTVADILKGNSRVIALTGSVGTGKSHLAMSCLYATLDKSGFKKNCVFVAYAVLLDELRVAQNDPELRRELYKVYLDAFEKADVVVLDDIGSEIGSGREKATAYDIEQLNLLLDSRKGKSLIYTTNLTGDDIKKYYDERVQSRLLDRMSASFVRMQQTPDYRKQR